MSIWAIISIYPLLLLCAPSAILSIILVKTHQARFPPRPSSDSKGSGAGPGGGGKSGSNGGVESSPAQALNDSTQRPTKNKYIGSARPPLTPNPPNEGSIHYYENLRDIQNMMKMVTDAYDLIVPIVSYLNWSSYPRSLLVFQLSILATVAMFFLGPFIPLRLIMFLSVEGIFVMNHPWTLPALQGMSRRARKSKEGRMITNWLKEMGHVVREWVERDRLDDEVWEKGWRDVEMFEEVQLSRSFPNCHMVDSDFLFIHLPLPGSLHCIPCPSPTRMQFFDLKKSSRNQRFQATSTAGSKEVSGTWSAHNLTFGERKSWTKGSDGWSEENLQVTGYSVDIR
ncbi:hypothetical protein IE53DRAFT_390242 [Violaceomyces palustris]|uniref:Uncharacterized protein n=1 Tax=Violaceomyces palustris TaxID=1673888 RepID=A0ACD0NPA4_9BASI|nr:hypothetical protein IE53DRAFT_390242 [Violaceomyces palustris]